MVDWTDGTTRPSDTIRQKKSVEAKDQWRKVREWEVREWEVGEWEVGEWEVGEWEVREGEAGKDEK